MARKASRAVRVKKQPEIIPQEAASISNVNVPPQQIALMIQYGQLFNEYRWFLFWRVYLGFTKPLADFLSAAMQNVVDKLSGLKVPSEVDHLHRSIVARVVSIHQHIVDQVTFSQAGSNPEFVDHYAVIMNRDWDEDVSDDAEAAMGKLHSLLFAIWGHIEHLLNDLCGELSKFSNIKRRDSIINQNEVAFLPDSPPFLSSPSTYDYQLWMAFHAGSIVDQLVRPTHPRLTFDHQIAVYQRVYFIKDHLEKLNRPVQPQQLAAPPVPNVSLSDLPAGNDDVTDNYVIDFLCAFCRRYKLNDYSTALKENLGQLHTATFSPVSDSEDKIVENDHTKSLTLNQRQKIKRIADNQLISRLTNTKQRKSFIYGTAFKQLIYDQGFVPTHEDLKRLRNLVQRLKLQLDIPDLRTLFPEMDLNVQQEICGHNHVESLFDALIRRESIWPGEEIVHQIVRDTSRLPSPPKELDIKKLFTAQDYQERANLLETFIRDMVNSILYQGIRSNELNWLKDNIGPVKYSAYLKYLRISEDHGEQSLPATDAVELMARPGATGFFNEELEEERKKEANNMIRYINDAKKALNEKLGDTIPDRPIAKGIITSQGPDIGISDNNT